MFVPPYGLRHLGDQVLWNAPSFLAWPDFQGDALIRFRRDSTLESSAQHDVNGLLVIDNSRQADFCVVLFAGEGDASQDVMTGLSSGLLLTVWGQPTLGATLTRLPLFATRPGEVGIYDFEKAPSWVNDGGAFAAQSPQFLPPFQGHAGSSLISHPTGDAVAPGWPWYGDVNANLNGFWSMAWAVGRLAGPTLSCSGYRRLLVELRCQMGEFGEIMDHFGIRGTIAAALYEFPADYAGLRRG